MILVKRWCVLFLLCVVSQADAACPVERVASQAWLAQAVQSGKPLMQVLVAAETGKLDSVAQRVIAMGGRVLVRFGSVDYLRAELPVGKYISLCSAPEVAALVPNGEKRLRGLQDSKPSRRTDPMAALDAKAQKPKPTFANPRPLLTADKLVEGNPYVPIHQVGALALRKLEPRADGRGVTVANMEGLFDPAHETLRGALDINGRPIGKIAGVIDASATEDLIASDPMFVSGAPEPDHSLVKLDGSIIVGTDRVVQIRGRRITAPRAGEFFAGKYQTKKVARIVLWNQQRELWVDTNDDGDFNDELLLREIGATTDKQPAYTKLRESKEEIAARSTEEKQYKNPPTLIMQFDVKGRPHLYVPSSGHSIMVSTTVAGSRFFGSAAGSAAPAARLMEVNANNDNYDRALSQLIESYILAGQHPEVDVLTVSDSMAEVPHSTGDSVIGLICERLARIHGKLLVNGAGNHGVLARPYIYSDSPLMLSVGAYYGADTIKALYGWTMPQQDNVMGYSAGGPSLHGGLKPDLVAPTMSITGDNCGREEEWSHYLFPDCYDVGNGTSNATPFAASAAAALISAAKQNNLPHDAKHIAWALRTGAKSLQGYSTAEAGAGLIQLERSWELLQSAPTLPAIKVDAPVERSDAAFFRTPGRGSGLMLHDGWFVGKAEKRTVSIDIAAVSPRKNYRLKWRGNDGSFELASIATLKLKSDTKHDLTIAVAPKTSGMHSAALELIDMATDVPVSLISMAVVAADRPALAVNSAVEQTLSAPWARSAPAFVDVPEGVMALRFDLHGKEGRVCHANMTHPNAGIDASDGPQWHFWNTLVKGDWYTASVMYPAAGAWQVRIDPCREAINRVVDEPQYHVPLKATATWTLYGAQIQASETQDITNTDYRVQVGLTNHGAPLKKPRLIAAPGRIANQVEVNLTAAPIQYEFNVDADASNLFVSLDLSSPQKNSQGSKPPLVDLYVYRCDKECSLVQLRPGRAWSKRFRIQDPTAGRWKVLLMPVDAGGSQIKLSSAAVVTAPQFGEVAVSMDSDAVMTAGSSRSATIRVTAAERVGADVVALVDLVDMALDDPAERIYARVQKAPFVDWPPVPVGTAVIKLGKKE